ncbi:FGGY carbohydrate kinase domain-containing protein-like isoform X2 [Oncorhynchus tshawytscha]|uniref:FGGY carbohydrate kinase domain-containing protein-like isoform X2 n=1 Tax=Oncorhynchus tshawytscha TaxID=74940 RepID=UPI001C3D11F9|nr:FGGY carbohydrate kinase domain-containing protein-like isoform X2 [Oncorhynchus tshawytscha]
MEVLFMVESDPVEWHCVGVGMGTARVSAALVTREGQMKTTAEEPVTIWEPHSDHYVQSSTDIWSKGCSTVRGVSDQSGAPDCPGGVETLPVRHGA